MLGELCDNVTQTSLKVGKKKKVRKKLSPWEVCDNVTQISHKVGKKETGKKEVVRGTM